MKNIIYIFILLFLQNGGLSAQVERSIASTILKTEINYWQKNIGTVTTSDSLNLLLLLDGDEYFGIATDVLTLYESDDKIKPTIVIALPSTIKSRWKYYTPTNAKPYDDSDEETIELFKQSGEFDQYARFIKEELIPHIEGELKIEFKIKTIFGHSMGGLAALSFLLFEESVFDNYVVASPSTIWDNYYLLEKLEAEVEQDEKSYQFKQLYITVAEDDIPNYEDGVNYLMGFLEKLINEEESRIIFKKYERETHMTVGLKTLFDGILLLMKK